MQSSIARRLIELNRKFYTDFGESFSATRGRIQPGVRRVLDSLDGDETILDLGCGNGELARTLARDSHRGAYLGLDFSLPLLADAESVPERFAAEFRKVDLASDWSVIARSIATKQSSVNQEIATLPLVVHNDKFDIVFSFATLHHIPSQSLRLNILKSVHQLLVEDGHFIHSNWQFLNSPRLRQRVREWSEAGLSEADVDENDYLLDWRSGGTGLRYVHHFSEDELAELAQASGFQIVDAFYSDGKEGNLAIYQTWEKR
ncbi:MAG: methyltransferase domain-containing protein [Anaerolineales bacterium]|jgi:SAM-dependent methyltransferase